LKKGKYFYICAPRLQLNDSSVRPAFGSVSSEEFERRFAGSITVFFFFMSFKSSGERNSPQSYLFFLRTAKLPLFTVVFLLFPFLFLSQTSPDAEQSRVISLSKKVEDENRLVTSMNPDSLASLPVGIIQEFNGTRYIIAIDSATFRPGMSTFSAYMALEFPGANEKICFAAKNIGFNPEGVMSTNNSKLMLVSQHRIAIGPKITVVYL
jgi:hypothetical protein